MRHISAEYIAACKELEALKEELATLQAKVEEAAIKAFNIYFN